MHLDEVIHKYMQSIRYIEELQNIFEEEQYKKSLRLEPKLSQHSHSSEQSNDLFSKITISRTPNEFSQKPKQTEDTIVPVTPTKFSFSRGHRKCQSLGTNVFSRLNSQDSLASNSSSSSTNRHLLDDSIINFSKNHSFRANNDSTTTCKVELTRSLTNSDENGSAVGLSEFFHGDFKEGFVRRKTLLKNNKRPVTAIWKNFWIQIWANQLIYFPSKYTMKGGKSTQRRQDFKQEPCKIHSLEGWVAISVENSSQDNTTFQLTNQDLGHVYKFRTSSSELTSHWLKALMQMHDASSTKTISSSGNLMTFD